MIIVMSYSELNSKTAQILKSIHEDERIIEFALLSPQKDVDDAHLVLLDLTANPEFQEILTSGYIVKELKENGLLDKVNTIDLYMSDVSPESRLSSLGQEIADLIYSTYHKDISVRVMTNPRFTYTLVIPPETIAETWKIIGIEVDEDEEKKIEKMKGIEAFHQLENKTLLWEGHTKQLNDYIKTQAQICKPLHILYQSMIGK